MFTVTIKPAAARKLIWGEAEADAAAMRHICGALPPCRSCCGVLAVPAPHSAIPAPTNRAVRPMKHRILLVRSTPASPTKWLFTVPAGARSEDGVARATCPRVNPSMERDAAAYDYARAAERPSISIAGFVRQQYFACRRRFAVKTVQVAVMQPSIWCGRYPATANMNLLQNTLALWN
jgi:hypothetical protein